MSIADTHRKNIPFLSSNSRKVVIGIDVCHSDKIKGWSVLTQMWLTFIPIVSPHLESYVCPLFNGNMPAYIVYMTHSPIVFCIGRSNESRRQNMVICRNSLHFDISSSFFLMKEWRCFIAVFRSATNLSASGLCSACVVFRAKSLWRRTRQR